jgi:hypothetical protein
MTPPVDQPRLDGDPHPPVVVRIVDDLVHSEELV